MFLIRTIHFSPVYGVTMTCIAEDIAIVSACLTLSEFQEVCSLVPCLNVLSGVMAELRDIGETITIRVVNDVEAFDRYWPRFVRSMGNLPFVGMKCKVSAKAAKTTGYVGADNDMADDNFVRVNVKSGRLKGHVGQRCYLVGKRLAGATKCSASLLALSCHLHLVRVTASTLSVSDGVALLALASFGGTVLLIRCCSFAALPEPLMRFLRTPNVIKIGQGIDRGLRIFAEHFGVHTSAIVDIRNVCLSWSWFVSNYDWTSHRFGVRSAAAFLFDDASILDEDAMLVDPIYTRDRLSSDQIQHKVAATQLLVDVCVVVQMRQLGIKLPNEWMSDEVFGQTLFYATAGLFDCPYLNDSLKPVFLRNSLRLLAHTIQMSNRLTLLNAKGKQWCAAEFWTIPMPNDDTMLAAILLREPGGGRGLPRKGYPLVLVNREVGCVASSSACIIADKNDKEYRFVVRIVALLENDEPVGWDGVGDPKNMSNIFPSFSLEGVGTVNPVIVNPNLRDRLMSVVLTRVASIRQQNEWSNGCSHNENTDRNVLDNWKEQLLLFDSHVCTTDVPLTSTDVSLEDDQEDTDGSISDWIPPPSTALGRLPTVTTFCRPSEHDLVKTNSLMGSRSNCTGVGRGRSLISAPIRVRGLSPAVPQQFYRPISHDVALHMAVPSLRHRTSGSCTRFPTVVSNSRFPRPEPPNYGVDIAASSHLFNQMQSLGEPRFDCSKYDGITVGSSLTNESTTAAGSRPDSREVAEMYAMFL